MSDPDFTESGSADITSGEIMEMGNAEVSWIGCPNCDSPVMVIHFSSRKE
jgi:hypothetical protein